MARIKFSGLVSEISGSIGGATLQRSAGGAVIRNKPRPINRTGTTLQGTTRKYMSFLQSLWQNMNPPERLVWTGAVSYYSPRMKHNSDIELSPYQFFMKWNLLLMLSGHSANVSVNLLPFSINFTAISFYNDGGFFYCYITADELSTNNFFLLRLSAPHKENKAADKNRCRIIICQDDIPGEYEISSRYNDIFGVVPAVDYWITYSITFFGGSNANIQGPIVGTYKVQEP